MGFNSWLDLLSRMIDGFCYVLCSVESIDYVLNDFIGLP